MDPTDANGLLDPRSLLGNLRCLTMVFFLCGFYGEDSGYRSLPDDMVKIGCLGRFLDFKKGKGYQR